MSERLERLQREIAVEKELALAELGLSFQGPLLVYGSQTPRQVIDARLANVPTALHEEATTQMMRHLIVLPWLDGRRVGNMGKAP